MVILSSANIEDGGVVLTEADDEASVVDINNDENEHYVEDNNLFTYIKH